MIFSPEHIHDLVRKLKAARSISQKLGILLNAPEFEITIYHPDEATQLWTTAYQTGFLELLMSDLTGPMGDKTVFARFFIAAAHIIELCVSIGCHAITQPAERRLIVERIPNIFRRTITIGQGLGKRTDPDMINDIHVLYQTVISLVAQSFVLVEYDVLLVESIEKGELMNVVLDVAFVQSRHFPPDAMELALESCARCISPISFQAYAKKNSQGPVVKKVVAKCGPDVIAAACTLMWLAAEDPDWVNGLANLLILVHEGSTGTLQKAFIRKGTYQAVLQSYWKVSRRPALSGTEISTLTTLRAIVLASLIQEVLLPTENKGSATVIQLMTDLVEHADFLLFISKVLLAPSSFLVDPNTTFQEFVTRRLHSWNHWISRACSENPYLVDAVCRPTWTHVMHRLLTLDRCNRPRIGDTDSNSTYKTISFAIEQWRYLGRFLRLDDPTDVADEPDWTPRSGERPSCSWTRCPLNQPNVGSSSQPRWEMLRCTGCRKVQYCGPSCQKRDWKSSHRAECAGSS